MSYREKKKRKKGVKTETAKRKKEKTDILTDTKSDNGRKNTKTYNSFK